MTALMDLKRHCGKKRVLEESSRTPTLWPDTFIYESTESRKKQNESNGSHLPRHHYWTSKDTGKKRVLEGSSRNSSLWVDTFIYESTESRKKQNESNGSHLP
jgi:hypothetical protein